MDAGSRSPASRARPPVGRALWLGSAGPALFGLALLVAGGALAELLGRSPGLVRAGGLVGLACAWLLSLGVGLWTRRALAAEGSRYWLPFVSGFLAKLACLGGGIAGFALVWPELGDAVAFGLFFAAAAFSFQMLYLLVLVGPLAPRRAG